LNENMRGSMGGSEMPQSMQAKRSLIQNGSASPSCTSMRPSPSLSASSTLSVRRLLMPSLRTMRSTTTSRSCVLVRSSSSSSPRSTTDPSMRARTKPSRRSLSSSSFSSPLRARAMGASTDRRAPSGRASTRSTICWTVCASMRLPQLGQ
jgi:hypothetical protein